MLEDFKNKFKEIGAKLELLVNLNDNCKDSVWYGGTVAVIYYKDYEIVINAEGDVVASLFDDASEEICSVKDKSNLGLFTSEIGPSVESDEKMKKLEEAGNLVFLNNNWFEVEIFKKGESIPNISKVLSHPYIDGAIEEVFENLKNNEYELEEM